MGSDYPVHPVLGTPAQERHGLTGASSAQDHQGGWGWSACLVRLSEPRVVRRTKGLQEHLTEVFQNQEGYY